MRVSNSLTAQSILHPGCGLWKRIACLMKSNEQATDLEFFLGREIKLVSEFEKDVCKAAGIRKVCKACQSSRQNARYSVYKPRAPPTKVCRYTLCSSLSLSGHVGQWLEHVCTPPVSRTYALCRRCGEEKLSTEFSPKKSNADGLRSECKPCCNARARLRYQSSKSKRSAKEAE